MFYALKGKVARVKRASFLTLYNFEGDVVEEKEIPCSDIQTTEETVAANTESIKDDEVKNQLFDSGVSKGLQRVMRKFAMYEQNKLRRLIIQWRFSAKYLTFVHNNLQKNRDSKSHNDDSTQSKPLNEGPALLPPPNIVPVVTGSKEVDKTDQKEPKSMLPPPLLLPGQKKEEPQSNIQTSTSKLPPPLLLPGQQQQAGNGSNSGDLPPPLLLPGQQSTGGGLPPPPNLLGGGRLPPPNLLGGGGLPPPNLLGGGGLPPPNLLGGGGLPPPNLLGGGGLPPPNLLGGGGLPPPNLLGGGGLPPPGLLGGGGLNPPSLLGGIKFATNLKLTIF